jgi:hypothetical protein
MCVFYANDEYMRELYHVKDLRSADKMPNHKIPAHFEALEVPEEHIYLIEHLI